MSWPPTFPIQDPSDYPPERHADQPIQSPQNAPAERPIENGVVQISFDELLEELEPFYPVPEEFQPMIDQLEDLTSNSSDQVNAAAEVNTDQTSVEQEDNYELLLALGIGSTSTDCQNAPFDALANQFHEPFTPRFQPPQELSDDTYDALMELCTAMSTPIKTNENNEQSDSNMMDSQPSTSNYQSIPSVAEVTQNPVALPQAQDLAECSKAHGVGECSKTPDLGECSIAKDMGECSEELNLEECTQAQNLEECTQGHNLTECTQAQGAEECTQGQELGECSNAKDQGKGSKDKIIPESKKGKSATRVIQIQHTGDSPREQRNRAEKLRRDKLNESIAVLKTLVPPVIAMPRKIDKTTIMRLTAHYLRSHQYVFGDSIYDKQRFKSGTARLILSLLQGFVLTVTYRGVVVVVSPNVNQYLGYSELDLIGTNLFAIVHKEDEPTLREQLRPRTCNLDNHGELIVPDDTDGRSRVADMLAKERRHFVVRLKRLSHRSDPPNYVSCYIEGSLRKSDRACGGNKRCCQAARRARARSDNPRSSGNDVVFIGVVRPVTESFLSEGIVDSFQMEYRTRHSVDGEIIQCEQRIALVTGYMTNEVSGINGMNFMHRDDVRWVIVALREMYDQHRLFGESCYRLMTKNGEFIYMRTRGRLDVDRTSKIATTFVCTNRVVGEEEGKYFINQMKKRYTILVNNGIDAIMPMDTTHGDELFDSNKYSVEDPRQLEKVILHLVMNLPTPGPINRGGHGSAEGYDHISIVPPKKERIVSAIKKIESVLHPQRKCTEIMAENNAATSQHSGENTQNMGVPFSNVISPLDENLVNNETFSTNPESVPVPLLNSNDIQTQQHDMPIAIDTDDSVVSIRSDEVHCMNSNTYNIIELLSQRADKLMNPTGGDVPRVTSPQPYETFQRSVAYPIPSAVPLLSSAIGQPNYNNPSTSSQEFEMNEPFMNPPTYGMINSEPISPRAGEMFSLTPYDKPVTSNQEDTNLETYLNSMPVPNSNLEPFAMCSSTGKFSNNVIAESEMLYDYMDSSPGSDTNEAKLEMAIKQNPFHNFDQSYLTDTDTYYDDHHSGGSGKPTSEETQRAMYGGEYLNNNTCEYDTSMYPQNHSKGKGRGKRSTNRTP